MPGKYDIEGYGTYEIDSDDDAEIQSTIAEIIAHEKAARASRPTLGGPTGLASKRLAALGGKPESEKGDFAPQPTPIAGNAIPAIEPVIAHAIGAAGQNPISSTLPGDLAGDGVRKYVPEEWYQAPKKDIRPEARRRYAALTDQVAPLEEGPETPKFIERHSRAMTAAIPETSAAPSAGGRFLRALDEHIAEMNPTNPAKPSDMLKAPGQLAEALNDYTDNAALLPISKLAGYLPDDPTWIPGAPAIQALANTRFGRGAVRGSGVNVGEGPVSYKQGIEAALKVPEGFSRAGDVATLGAMGLPVVGPALLAGMIPEQIGHAGSDLGEIAGGLIGGDPEGAGMRAPGAAVNAGMLGLMGAHGLKSLEQGRMAEAAAKEQAAMAATERAAAPWYSQDFRAPEDVMAAARGDAHPLQQIRRGEYAPPPQPPPFVSGPEGQAQGPFPVPPDVFAQGRTLPADLQARTGNATRPAPPVDPEAARVLASILSGGEEPPPAPTLQARPPQPTVGDAPSWQDRQRAERASPAKPPAEENIQVEPKATTDAQLAMVKEGQGQPGKKPGVLYTVQGGAKPPDVVPEGLARVDGPAGTLIFDPTKVTPEQAREALTSGEGLDKALGFSGPRPEPHPDNAVVSVLGKDGVEKSSQVAGPTTFRTEQGVVPEGQTRGTSSYTVDAQGRTTRAKGQHFGHDTKDVGVKTPSDRTVYVDENASTRLGALAALPKGTKATVIEKDGRLYPATWNDAAGKWGLAPADRAGYPIVSDTPKVGLHPVELWGPREGPQGREYRSSHAGNRIVEVTPGDVEGAVKAAQGMAGEGDQVAVRTPDEVIADRQAGIEAEKKPPLDLKGIPAKVREHADGNVAAAGDSRVVTLRGDRGDAFVVHESANEPGAWQLTHLDKDGSPSGHRLFKSREDAIRSASGQVVRGDPSSVGSGYKVERRVEDKGPEGRLHFVDVGQIAQDKLNEALDLADEARRISEREAIDDAVSRARAAEILAPEHAEFAAAGREAGGLPRGGEAARGPAAEGEGLPAPVADAGAAPEAPRAPTPEPGVRPAAEPVAPGARKALLDERAASIEERRELQRKIREDSLSPKKLARAKEELRETELHLKALDKKLGYEAGGPTATQVEADLKERFGDRYEPEAPEPVEAPAAEMPKGKPARVWVSPTEPLDVEYKIVEADTVRTSHDKRTGEPTPGFPQRKQPRDRSRESYLRQQAEIGQRPNPDLLLEGPEASVGAPITSEPGPEGIRDAEHGNGRTNGIRIAYEDGNAGEYRQRLIDDAARYGTTPEAVAGMREPMLIRERKTDLSAKEQVAIAKESNKGTAERMGTAEQAAVDAGAMTPELLSQFAPSESGDIMAASNRPFLRGFFSEIADSGDMVDRAGNVSAAGVARVKAAILAKAYGETSVLERALEAADDNTRNVSAGLLSAAPRVAKVRAMAESGELHPVDFTTPIKEAVDHLAHARDQGVSVADYLDQQDLFGDQISPEGRDVLSFLDKNKRSPKKIAGFIDSLARAVEAAGHPDQTDLFGGAPDAPSRAETFASAKRIYESRFESEGTQTGLFDQTGSGGPDRGAGPGAAPGGGGGAPGGGRPGGGEPGVYGSPSRSRRALARSRAGGAEATLEPEPVRPGGPAPETTVRPDVEPGDGVYEAPTSAPRAATMTGPGKKAETNPRQIIKELERITGTPIRYNFGHFAQRGAEGWFNRETNAIRMKQAEDLVTGAHEAGHSLHTFALKDQQHFPAAVSIELTRLGRDLYGPKPPNSGYIREGMAEYVAKYLIGDDMTKDAPAVHSWVRSNMPAEKLKALDAARELYEKWDVAGSVGQVKGKMVDADTSFVSRMKDGLDKLVRMAAPKMWTNKFSGLDEAMREVTDQLGLTEVHPMQDVARLAAALEKNATGSAYAAVTEGVPDLAGKKAGAGLKDALDKIGFKRLEDFAAYAYARRAVDLWERRAYDPDTKKRTGDPTPINPGISLRVAKHAVQQLESPEFRDALDKVTEWSNHLIDYVVKSGGLTPEEAVIIREANPVYVPLKRFFEESVQRGERGGGGGGMYRIKGGGRSVLNPIDSLVEHAATMIRLGDRLRVARAVADLVDPVNVGQSGTKGYGGLAWFAEKIQAPKDSTSFGVADIQKQLEAAGADLTGADLGRVLTVFQNAKEYHGKQNIISIVRNGTREFYEVDPRVYEVLMRTEPHAVNPVMQALQAAKRGVQLGATGLNAGFSLVSNVLRDMPTSSIYSKSPGLVTPIDTFKAVWKEIQKSPEAQRWERGGGSMSTLIGQDRLASRRIIEEMLAKTPTEKGWVTFKHPVDALRKGLGIFESGPRIAEYERMLKVYEQKYGVDSEAAHLMAMLASKDVTVNFTRAGIVSEAINRIVPFFNARIQGASKFYRTFGGDYLESRGTARQPDAGKAALAATAKAMAWITVPTFALWVANKDEEWYQELPAWQKGAFWVWSPDHGKTKYRIPKPMELGWVFGSLPEAAWDYAYRQNKRGVMDALAGTVNSLMPIDVTRGASSLADLIPAGAKPLLEFGINYDAFRNRPIVDPFLERRKLPKDQYQRQTSETAKKLGEWLNISPSKIDHLAGGLTGGLAIDAVKAMELAVGARKAGSIEGLYDVPVLNRLALRPAPGASVDHMHEQDALLRQKVGSKVATEEEKATLKRIAAAKTAIDHARLAAEGAKGDDLHALNTWSTHMAQWALGKRAEMPEEELEALEEKFPSEEWGKAAKGDAAEDP